jgi:putative transcriptional regulator
MPLVSAPDRGVFLVASPLLRDPNFVRTVVLLCDHGEGGTWGLVVNRRTALTFGELLEDLPFPASAQGPVFWGGPVEPSRMQVLHRLRRGLPDELEVVPNLRLGLDADMFRKLAGEPRAPGEAMHAYVGHAGWGPGQLEAELETGSWFLCTAEDSVVFDTPADAMWEAVLRALGPKYARLVGVPLDPRVN